MFLNVSAIVVNINKTFVNGGNQTRDKKNKI